MAKVIGCDLVIPLTRLHSIRLCLCSLEWERLSCLLWRSYSILRWPHDKGLEVAFRNWQQKRKQEPQSYSPDYKQMNPAKNLRECGNGSLPSQASDATTGPHWDCSLVRPWGKDTSKPCPDSWPQRLWDEKWVLEAAELVVICLQHRKLMQPINPSN